MSRVRTNIEIEETYVRRIMERYHLRTKTEAVDMALRRFAWLPMTREEMLAMQGSDPDFAVPPESGPASVE